MFSKYYFKKDIVKLYESLISCDKVKSIELVKLEHVIENIVNILELKYRSDCKHFIRYVNIIISKYPIIYLLIDKFNSFNYDIKIYVVKIISYVLYTNDGVYYFLQHQFIIDEIFYHFREDDVALNFGYIIKEFIKHKDIVHIIIFTPSVYLLLLVIKESTLEKSSLSFEIVNAIFEKHENIMDYFLEHNYDRFIEMYLSLINSNNYIIVRKSLDLLYFILTNYKYFNKRFLSSIYNMKFIASFQNNPSEKIQKSAHKIYCLFVEKYDDDKI
tara:strand:- start:328 stop:1143 length:816 start_codon:yes stop_codon:yes gene_type:complete